MTAYSPSQHTHNPSLGQALTFRPEANGSVTVTLPPALVSTIGNLAMAVMQASGLTVVPTGYTPPPTDEELAQQERLERRNKDIEERSRLQRLHGRIFSSRHRKLMRDEKLGWYEAAQRVADEGWHSYDGNIQSTADVMRLMKVHKDARDIRLTELRHALILRYAKLGLTNAEIAERIGGHAKSIGKWKKEAVNKLTRETQRGSR